MILFLFGVPLWLAFGVWCVIGLLGPRMKKCPHCAEQIRREAVVCKHCHRDVPVPAPTPMQPALRHARPFTF